MIDEWAGGATAQARAKFHARLRFLRPRLPAEWDYEYAHKRKSEGDVWEIKFEANKIAHRPLFFLGTGTNFTIMIFAIEHNDKLKPPNASKTASARRKEIDNGANKPVEYHADQ